MTAKSIMVLPLAVESGSGAAQAITVRAGELHQCSGFCAKTSIIRCTGWAIWTWGEPLTCACPPVNEVYHLHAFG